MQNIGRAAAASGVSAKVVRHCEEVEFLDKFGCCPTAVVVGCVVDGRGVSQGHQVAAGDEARRRRARCTGLPAGSPGKTMGACKAPYDVLLVDNHVVSASSLRTTEPRRSR